MANGNGGTTSVWRWMWILLVLAIPIVNLIMLIYWAIKERNTSCRNYFRAVIAWNLIGIAFFVTLNILVNLEGTRKWIGKQLQSYFGAEEPSPKSKTDSKIIY